METKIAWYKDAYIWLVIGGPILVIIASFITVYLALKYPDKPIDNYYIKGVQINQTIDAERNAMAPAVQGRNHAATGVKPSSP